MYVPVTACFKLRSYTLQMAGSADSGRCWEVVASISCISAAADSLIIILLIGSVFAAPADLPSALATPVEATSWRDIHHGNDMLTASPHNLLQPQSDAQQQRPHSNSAQETGRLCPQNNELFSLPPTTMVCKCTLALIYHSTIFLPFLSQAILILFKRIL